MFDSNSHVEKSQGLWRFDRCIYNRDRKGDLRFDWFVPDWASYAPSNTPVEGHHYSNEASPRRLVLNSCLQYGDAEALTTADFLGDEDEKAKAAKEDRSACRASAPTRTAAAEGVAARPLTTEITLYFPSDSRREHDTMLVLNARYSISTEDRGITGRFDYKLSPLPGREAGDPGSIVMRPILRGESERMTPFFNEMHRDGGVRLNRGDDLLLYAVRTPEPASRRWHFENGALQFLDAAGQPVARTQIPLFVPQP